MKALSILGLALFVSTAIHAKTSTKVEIYKTKKTDSISVVIPDTSKQTIVFPNPFLFIQVGNSVGKKD